MQEFKFERVQMPDAVNGLRQEVRAFIAAQVAAGNFTPKRNAWSSFDAAFSRKCGERGVIGMRWPRQYGGAEKTALERDVMTGEMLAGGAPVGARWVADRQSGYRILRYA